MQPSNVYIQQVKKLYKPTSLCVEPLSVSIQHEKKLYGPTSLSLETSNVFIQHVKWSGADILQWNFLEPSADVIDAAREQSDGLQKLG